MSTPVRVVIVDDQEMTRLGLRMLLESRSEVEVVGDADDGDTALALLRELEADVVLMDVRMPRLDGIEATRRLRGGAGPRVLVLTTFDEDEHAMDAVRAGAAGFLLKDAPLDELVTAILHVHRGDAVLAPSTTGRLLTRWAAAERPPARETPSTTETGDHDSLTPREQDVLRLVADGLSNAEIATSLGIAESTVRVHVSRVLAKLGLRNRVQAVIHARGSTGTGGAV